MSLHKQIQKLNQYDVLDRSHFERIGAMVLTAATVLSIAAEGHEANKHHAKVNTAGQATFTASHSKPAEKNEIVRMPIRFNDGLRATATTGA